MKLCHMQLPWEVGGEEGHFSGEAARESRPPVGGMIGRGRSQYCGDVRIGGGILEWAGEWSSLAAALAGGGRRGVFGAE